MIDKIVELILKEIDEKERLAPFQGEWQINSVRLLKEQLKFYEYGRNGEIPPEWQNFMKLVDKN